MIDEQIEQAAHEAYRLLKPYIDEMYVTFQAMTPASLEVSQQRGGLNYSYHVLEAAIGVWEAWRELEAACWNQIP